LSQFHAESLRAAISGVRNAFPVRLKAALVVEPSILVRVLWKIVRPWLSAKLADRVHLLDMEELPAHVAPEQLPPAYGGSNPDNVDAMCAAFRAHWERLKKTRAAWLEQRPKKAVATLTPQS